MRLQGAKGTGGAERDRTDDLLSAIQALSQLSYSPTRHCSESIAVNGAALRKNSIPLRSEALDYRGGVTGAQPRYDWVMNSHRLLTLLTTAATLCFASGAGAICPDFAPHVDYGTGASPAGLVIEDVDRDGNRDLVVVSQFSASISTLRGNGNGTFATATNSFLGGFPRALSLADFDEDGILDAAVVDEYQLRIARGNGDGTFSTPVAYSTGGLTRISVATGDFNGDGYADVAVPHYNSSNVGIVLGNGDGTLRSPILRATGNNPRFIAVGDFDGNGFADLAIARDPRATVDIVLGNGDGTFKEPVSYSVGPQMSRPWTIAVADFDRDGAADLAVANTSTASIVVLMGNGDGTFAQRAVVPAGVGFPFSVVAADLDRDGYPDLALSQVGTNRIAVFVSNGDGTFDQARYYPVGKSPAYLAAADLNGDGFPDLASANQESLDASVLINTSSGCPPPVDFRRRAVRR